MTGSLPVTVVPDVSDFAAALDEEAGGLSVTVKVTPEMSGFEAAAEELTGAHCRGGSTRQQVAASRLPGASLCMYEAATSAASSAGRQCSVSGTIRHTGAPGSTIRWTPGMAGTASVSFKPVPGAEGQEPANPGLRRLLDGPHGEQTAAPDRAA
jgi:hypothetical protein